LRLYAPFASTNRSALSPITLRAWRTRAGSLCGSEPTFIFTAVMPCSIQPASWRSTCSGV
jgi:hypothetical protein